MWCNASPRARAKRARSSASAPNFLFFCRKLRHVAPEVRNAPRPELCRNRAIRRVPPTAQGYSKSIRISVVTVRRLSSCPAPYGSLQSFLSAVRCVRQRGETPAGGSSKNSIGDSARSEAGLFQVVANTVKHFSGAFSWRSTAQDQQKSVSLRAEGRTRVPAARSGSR